VLGNKYLLDYLG